MKVYVMQNYVKISENSVKNLEILLNISRVFCKLVDLGSLMGSTHAVNIVKQVLVGNDAYCRTTIQQQQLPCVALGVGSVVTRLVMVVIGAVGLEH